MVGDACHALVLRILKEFCSDVFLGLRVRAGCFCFFSETLFWRGEFLACCSESFQSIQKWKGVERTNPCPHSASPTSPTSPFPSRFVLWHFRAGAWHTSGVPRLSPCLRREDAAACSPTQTSRSVGVPGTVTCRGHSEAAWPSKVPVTD